MTQEKRRRQECDVDTGWAWPALGAAFFGASIAGFFYVTGLFNVVFLDVFQASKSSTAIISTLNVALLHFMAPVAGILIRASSARLTIIVGGLLTGLGCFLSFYANGIFYLTITFGVLIGAGFGLAYSAIGVQVAFYFDRYQTMAYGIMNAGVGLGSIALAFLFEILLDTYGWRGTCLIFAGILFNLCVCGVVMRPVSSQLKKQAKNPEPRSEKRVYFHLDVFKNVPYLLLCLNALIVYIAAFAVPIHLPASAISRGATLKEASRLMSAFALSNCVGRLLSGLILTNKRIDIVTWFSVTQIIAGICLIPTPYLMNSPAGRICIMVVFASIANSHVPLVAPVCIKFVGLQRVETAVGVVLSVSGIGCIIGPILAAYLADITGTYDYTFYMGAVAYILGGVITLFIPIMRRLTKPPCLRYRLETGEEISTTDIYPEEEQKFNIS